jgi:glycosyltransferase involved in cell wall biosynthesis
MNPPIVSVIVAAYNAEKYLERCLNSIAAQTLTNFEAIVIDDGSVDKTGTIADSFVHKDARFKVIHKENEGVAAARQAGINLAKGTYSIHVDSDDWVEPDMLKDLSDYAESENADIVFFDYYEISKDGEQYNCQRPSPTDRISVWGQTMNSLAGSLCNKLIRHKLYSYYNISFDKRINFEEDKLVCLKLLSNNITVRYLNKGYYHYDHTQNDTSTSVTGFSPQSRLTILEQIESYCDITPVQSYYDQSVFYLAYQALFVPRSLCPNYVRLFKDYLPSILRAKGFPRRSKCLVLLRMHHIRLPLLFFKRAISRLKA